MKQRKRYKESGIKADYSQFSNPFFGLATMIFVQAAVDYSQLGEREYIYDGLSAWSRYEITLFFRSEWAEFLAAALGTSAADLFRALEGKAA